MTSYPPGNVMFEPPPPKKRRVWVWVLVVFGICAVLACAGICGGLIWLGNAAPEIEVYTGNAVPQRYLDEMAGLGALETGERIEFFYSDGFFDIADGFYYVSDRRVVIYSSMLHPTMTSVTFDEIADAELLRDLSFFDDSTIFLTLHDGQMLSFPVSSEGNGDERFFNAIEKQITADD